MPDVAPNDSVLTSTKLMLGIGADYTEFDIIITLHINSVFSTLYQLGLGSDEQLRITDANDTWTSVIANSKAIDMVKSYMYLRVRQLFDPPATGFVTDSFDRQLKEIEWRLNVALSSSPNI